MKFGVVVFPGSNCDADAIHVVAEVLGCETKRLWHKDHDLQGSDVVIVPGGFSYGDYLRCGAIARFAPIMDEVAKHAAKGGPVLGICNGFQVLTEAGLLPGVLQRNDSLQFICKTIDLQTENNGTRFTKALAPKERLRVPIAHAEGNYFIDDDGLRRLEGEGQVAFRYVGNPNGSRNHIAGVLNASKNVMGMMPHPERASEALLGSADGLKVFQSLIS